MEIKHRPDKTRPSLNVCAFLKDDGRADSVPRWFFSFSRVDHEPRTHTWLLFQSDQVQRKSTWPGRLFADHILIAQRVRLGPKSSDCFFVEILLIFVNFHWTAGSFSTPLSRLNSISDARLSARRETLFRHWSVLFSMSR